MDAYHSRLRAAGGHVYAEIMEETLIAGALMIARVTDGWLAARIAWTAQHDPLDPLLGALRELEVRRRHDLTEPQLADLLEMARLANLDGAVMFGPERRDILADVIEAHAAGVRS